VLTAEFGHAFGVEAITPLVDRRKISLTQLRVLGICRQVEQRRGILIVIATRVPLAE